MILLLPLLAALFASPAVAADRVIDLSSGCKVYKLTNKKWVETEGSVFEGVALKASQILRDEKFTVFRSGAETFGVNQKCVAESAGEEALPVTARPTGKRKSAAQPAEDPNRSPWSAAFSLGMNLGPSGTVTRSYLGVKATPEKKKFKSSILFMGEANYRLASFFRIGAEIALTQLQEDSQTGNEVSFFDIVPQFLIPMSDRFTLFAGPTLGLYFLAQNAQRIVDDGNELDVKQQTASAMMMGGVLGGDYHLNEQFDLGLFLRYFKPGTLKVTGTVRSPTAGAFESELSASYMTAGVRFMIRF